MIAEAANPALELRGLRILIVEDEALVAMLLEQMLEDSGCQAVEWATTVSAALRAIETSELDGALLDVNLSGAEVYPVAEVLNSRNLPFVFVTGYGRTPDIASRFPNAPVLKKPFEAAQLARLVRHEIMRLGQSGA